MNESAGNSAAVERLFAVGQDKKIADRIAELGEKASAGTLSANERDEYSALIDVCDIVSILQLKARARIGGSAAK